MYVRNISRNKPFWHCGFTVAVLLLALGVTPVAAENTQQPQRSSQKINPNARIEHYRSLIRQHPQTLAYYNNLAVLYAREGDLKSAQEVLQQGLKARQDVATLYNNLNKVFLEMSREDYAAALRLDLEPRKINLATLEIAAAQPPAPAVVKETREQTTIQGDVTGIADQQQVKNTVLGWASAWSAQEVDLYLSFYASDFIPTGSLSRGQWEAARRKRLTLPKWVRVKVSDLTVSPLGPQKTRVVFKQTYRSSNYSDMSRKELLLQQTDSGWKIVKERTL